MSEALEHVFRSKLPWRPTNESLTECGLPAASYSTVTPEQMREKIKRDGERRAAFSSCMTCWEAMRNNAHYEARNADGVDAVLPILRREIEAVYRGRGDGGLKLSREVRALAMLAERHPDEFANLRSEMDEAVNLMAYRRDKQAGVRP